MTSSNFARELARLEARARHEPRLHSRPAAKLEPLRRLLAALDHPERGSRVVHVAGTNGKGTTAAIVARLLESRGERVGLYTSPHLVDIRERIRVNGALLDEEGFASAAKLVLDSAERERGIDSLSYFDLLTALAFVAFREQCPDWIVLETGLGGTADSTNVTGKELAIITPIGHDHMAVLGDELRSIAEQKLGIVPPGVPAVIAEQPKELQEWISGRLASQGSQVWPSSRIALRHEETESVSAGWPGGAPVSVPMPMRASNDARLACAATALTALDVLAGPPSGETERRSRATVALTTALPARQQWIEGARLAGPPYSPLPALVLDGAHNREALAALCRSLAQWGVRDYLLLVGLMADKLVPAVEPVLAELLAGAETTIAVALPFARAAAPDEWKRYLERIHPRRESVTLADPLGALALAAARPERNAVAAGSLWMAGEFLKAMHVPDPKPATETRPAQQPPAPAESDSQRVTDLR